MPAKWWGRQLCRFKFGQGYYQLVMSSATAISLLSMAFGVRLRYSLLFLPAIIFLTAIVGYWLEKAGVVTEDARQGYEVMFAKPMPYEIRCAELLIAITEAMSNKDIRSKVKPVIDAWGKGCSG